MFVPIITCYPNVAEKIDVTLDNGYIFIQYPLVLFEQRITFFSFYIFLYFSLNICCLVSFLCVSHIYGLMLYMKYMYAFRCGAWLNKDQAELGQWYDVFLYLPVTKNNNTVSKFVTILT